MTQQMSFRDRPTDKDFQIFTDLWRYLRKRKINCFTADTFRELYKGTPDTQGQTPYDKAFPDATHDVGGWTRRLLMSGLIIDQHHDVHSTFQRNHGRRIRLYKVRNLEDLWEETQEQEA